MVIQKLPPQCFQLVDVSSWMTSIT